MARNREFPVAETAMSAQFGESSSNAGSVRLQGERLGSVISISLQPNSRHGLNGKIVRANLEFGFAEKVAPSERPARSMGLLCDNMTQPRVRFWIDFFAKVDGRQKIWHYTQMRWNYRVSEIELGFLT
jgi:hypothetical protein